MTENTQPDSNEFSFFRGGLFHQLLTRVGLDSAGPSGIRLRVLVLILLTYVPLLVLSIIQGVALNSHLKMPFLYDILESCRFLVVGPLLIAAEQLVEPWIVQVALHARERLINRVELPDFDKAISQAVCLRDSYMIEIVLLVCTFVWQWIEPYALPLTQTTSWYNLPGGNIPSHAWLWYAYFAKPLIRFLWLRWLWRYLIWALFLRRMSRLNLKIIAAHPDRQGGLAFINVGHCRFAALAFIFGIQSSSVLAEQILFQGKTLMSFQLEILGVVGLILVLFLTPLLAFTGKLLDAKRTGIFEYSALADEYTTDFHDKWVLNRGPDKLLGADDIQSLADLGTSYSVVREMKFCLIDKNTVMMFLITTLLPFTPLVLSVYPFDELVRKLLKAVI